MNEPKRRGRPPKARLLETSHINGDTSREPEEVLPVKLATAEKLAMCEKLAADAAAIRQDIGSALAQAYALRVWAGQSPDLPRNERLRRVAKALEGQGLSMEGVEL